MKVPKFESTGFSLLDVGVGRKALARYFYKRRDAKPSEGLGTRPVNKPIKVTIDAIITDQWGVDDGTSIEFEMKIRSIKIKE